MPEIRQDPTTREWVIIATERAKRPHEFASLSSAADQASRSCVFCRGNESQTAPFTHNASFGNTTDQELRELARVLGVTLRRLHRALDDPHFNLVIHTAPVEDELQAYFLWHVEITPRITTPAGFELGSGILVNPCVPEEAAEFLRDTCLC
jgi:galactose-1-phosphate uridylyltransferase